MNEPVMIDKDFRMLNYLRYLYGELRSDFKTMAIGQKAHEYEIPNYNVFCIVLTEKLILFKKRGTGLTFTYKWNSEFSPGVDLVNKIRGWMAEYSTKKQPREALGKKIDTVLKEQAQIEVLKPPIKKSIELGPTPPSIQPEDNSFLGKFIKELRAAGVKGTINITLEV